MQSTLEREIKLRFQGPAEARAAIVGLGASPMRGRRLQEDYLLDTPDGRLRGQQCVLRVRIEPGKSLLTFKGPMQPSAMKLREELETVVGDGDTLLRLLEQLGFTVSFRYQKYREEFGYTETILAVDETPIGTFVEIEGSENGINEAAAALGRTADEYLADSYRSLFSQYCQERGLTATDMLFDEP
ncbi:MAG: class IV adenylate cyclase [Vicinamibacterales bacterium]